MGPNPISWKRFHLYSAKNWFDVAETVTAKRDRKFAERESWMDLFHWASGL